MKKLIIVATLAAAAGCSADITPEDVKVADYKDGKECAVSLTFDDSMKEHYTIVAPELEKRGFRGTFWMVGSWMPTDPQADTTHFTWA
jgi:peptidoglycan/xylan/chitin deacetylase (PgdA/CDA1 family)